MAKCFSGFASFARFHQVSQVLQFLIFLNFLRNVSTSFSYISWLNLQISLSNLRSIRTFIIINFIKASLLSCSSLSCSNSSCSNSFYSNFPLIKPNSSDKNGVKSCCLFIRFKRNDIIRRKKKCIYDDHDHKNDPNKLFYQHYTLTHD